MSELKRICYTYKSVEAWDEYDEQVRKIVTEDVGDDAWVCTRALPPTCFPPPMSPEAIEKIKKINDDVVVREIEDD